MNKKTWRGKIKGGELWKLKFHGIVPTPQDRLKMKQAKATREKWNQLSHRFDPTPRLVKP